MDIFAPVASARSGEASSDNNSNEIQVPYSTPVECCSRTRVDPCMELHRSHPAEKLIKAFSIEGNFKTIFNGNLQREVFPVIGGMK